MIQKTALILILGLLLLSAGRVGAQSKAPDSPAYQVASLSTLHAPTDDSGSTETPTPTDVEVTTSPESDTETPSAGTETAGTEVPTEIIILTSTPRENGSIVHPVQKGEALWNISMAYNVSVAELIALNNLDVKNPVIYAGQKLLVRTAFTPTPSLTVTNTPRPPTITSRPSATRRPPRATRTPGSTETLSPGAQIKSGVSRQTVGIGIIIVSSLGLLALVVTGLIRKKE